MKSRVTVLLRERTATADVDARYDGTRVVVEVHLQDAEGRTLDWKLSREELSVIVHAAKEGAGDGPRPIEKSPPEGS